MTEKGPNDLLPPRQAELLGQVFAELPDDYAGRAAQLAAIDATMHRLAAERLAPALNAKIQAMPHETHEEKKELAKWVNEELRRLNLAIKGPTGEPSLLLVQAGHLPEIGRFAIEHKTPEGKRIRPLTSMELPQLELMEANRRREAILEWREKVGRQGGQASRA